MTVRSICLLNNRKQANGNDGVVEHGNNGGDAVNPFKPERDVDEHRAERDQHDVDGLLPQIGSNFGTDNLITSNGKITREALLF